MQHQPLRLRRLARRRNPSVMLSPRLLDGLWAAGTQGQRAAVRRAVLPLAVTRFPAASAEMADTPRNSASAHAHRVGH
eukprot:scaffold15050_cov66-Phaeocystis_antarctica.AAC.9